MDAVLVSEISVFDRWAMGHTVPILGTANSGSERSAPMMTSLVSLCPAKYNTDNNHRLLRKGLNSMVG